MHMSMYLQERIELDCHLFYNFQHKHKKYSLNPLCKIFLRIIKKPLDGYSGFPI